MFLWGNKKTNKKNDFKNEYLLIITFTSLKYRDGKKVEHKTQGRR